MKNLEKSLIVPALLSLAIIIDVSIYFTMNYVKNNTQVEQVSIAKK